ncbi:hypothetical protein DXG01_016808 [Tephrocybe rancida]|nr:hypothetical protein DXG01_016808 [Tephrocybe rancida]
MSSYSGKSSGYYGQSYHPGSPVSYSSWGTMPVATPGTPYSGTIPLPECCPSGYTSPGPSGYSSPPSYSSEPGYTTPPRPPPHSLYPTPPPSGRRPAPELNPSLRSLSAYDLRSCPPQPPHVAHQPATRPPTSNMRFLLTSDNLALPVMESHLSAGTIITVSILLSHLHTTLAAMAAPPTLHLLRPEEYAFVKDAFERRVQRSAMAHGEGIRNVDKLGGACVLVRIVPSEHVEGAWKVELNRL